VAPPIIPPAPVTIATRPLKSTRKGCGVSAAMLILRFSATG
jgi:hypothetical protein